jgi:hypothetical protein
LAREITSCCCTKLDESPPSQRLGKDCRAQVDRKRQKRQSGKFKKFKIKMRKNSSLFFRFLLARPYVVGSRKLERETTPSFRLGCHVQFSENFSPSANAPLDVVFYLINAT